MKYHLKLNWVENGVHKCTQVYKIKLNQRKSTLYTWAFTIYIFQFLDKVYIPFLLKKWDKPWFLDWSVILFDPVRQKDHTCYSDRDK